MKVLLLLSAAAALTAPTIAPPSVLDGLAQLAQRAVAAPEYRDPRDGTWGDNPVGGAAERDGSWLDQDTRAAIKAALAAMPGGRCPYPDGVTPNWKEVVFDP